MDTLAIIKYIATTQLIDDEIKRQNIIRLLSGIKLASKQYQKGCTYSYIETYRLLRINSKDSLSYALSRRIVGCDVPIEHDFEIKELENVRAVFESIFCDIRIVGNLTSLNSKFCEYNKVKNYFLKNIHNFHSKDYQARLIDILWCYRSIIYIIERIERMYYTGFRKLYRDICLNNLLDNIKNKIFIKSDIDKEIGFFREHLWSSDIMYPHHTNPVVLDYLDYIEIKADTDRSILFEQFLNERKKHEFFGEEFGIYHSFKTFLKHVENQIKY